MATTTNDGSGFSAVSGGTWSSTANAYDDNVTTFTSLTTTTAGAHVFDITGYSFSGTVGASDTLNSVVVRVYQYISGTSAAARWNNPTVQAYDGATAIGSPTTLTESTSSTNFDDVTITGVTLAQVRSANFKIRFTADKNGNQSATQNFGAAEVTVDYTAFVANRTGTVTGALTPLSGTVVGKEGAKGAVVGALTALSGAVVGKLGAKGSVTGALTTLSGTIVGKLGASGTVTGALTTLSATASGTRSATGTVTGALSTILGTITGTAAGVGNDKSGTVTGALTVTGTTAGTKDSTGTATGALTLSGTEAGSKGGTGTGAGSVTLDGTATGTVGTPGAIVGIITLDGTTTGSKDTTGTAAGSLALAGTTTGTKYDPDAPTPAPEEIGSGGGNYYRLQSWAAPAAPIVKTGRARGSITTPRASVRGRLGHSGTVVATCTITGPSMIHGARHARGRFFADAEARVHAHGEQTAPRDPEYLSLYAEVRRLRTENELLLTL